jgi:hypothetical protein
MTDMMTNNDILPYTPLRTGDYDEEGEIAFSRAQREQIRSLESLDDSLNRIGQMSLTLASEIEMQNYQVEELSLESESMHGTAESLQRTALIVNTDDDRNNQWLCCLIMFLLFMATSIFILKLFIYWKTGKLDSII